MASRRRPQDKEESDSPDWLKIISGAVAIGAAAYGFSRLLQSDEKESSSSRSSRSYPSDEYRSSSARTYTTNEFSSSRMTPVKPQKIVLAIDATPTHGGAVLVLHHKRLIYYYSLNWSGYLKFNCEPDKFEVINAFIALKTFYNLLEVEGNEEEEKLIIKGDNTKFKDLNSSPNATREDNVFWHKVNQLRQELNGEWKYVLKSEDKYLNHADKLSRGKQNYINELFEEEGYARTDMSSDALGELLLNLAEIPAKYRK